MSFFCKFWLYKFELVEDFFFSFWPKIIKSLLSSSQKGETLMVVNLENFLTKHPTWTSGTTK